MEWAYVIIAVAGAGALGYVLGKAQGYSAAQQPRNKLGKFIKRG